MRCFDVFVLATPAETFGLVIIEAMAAGVPVVAVNGGGIPEIITDRLNGLLFKSPNHLELANLINELSKNKSLALKIAESAVKTVRNKFEYKTQVDKYFDFCLKSHNQRGL